MTEEQKTRVKGYVTTLDSSIADGELLDLLVDTVGDRVLLYLNETTIGVGLERVIAQVIVEGYHSTTGETTAISRIEDNGQAITYRALSHFSSKSDEALFSGFDILKSYRRPHVIA